MKSIAFRLVSFVMSLFFAPIILLFHLLKRRNNQSGVIIFSRNRAFQLEGLLNSLQVDKAPVRIFVIYSADGEFIPAYSKLMKGFPSVFFLNDAVLGFREAVLVVSRCFSGRLSFLVDDLICFDSDKFYSLFEIDEVFTIALPRIGLNIDFSLQLCERTRISKYHSDVKGICHFRPTDASGDASYFFSVDGNIFCQSLIFPLLKLIRFDNPSKLESGLQIFSGMNCFLKGAFNVESCLVNIPLNLIQNSFCNYSAEIPTSYLNALFLSGKVFRPVVSSFFIRSPHVYLSDPYGFLEQCIER